MSMSKRQRAIKPRSSSSDFWEFERALWKRGLTRIAGVDEAGVGPLAGPVVAAAVMLPAGIVLPGIDDSKRLSARQREKGAELIRSKAVAWSIGRASVEEIDNLNIRNASILAMQRAVAQLDPAPEHVLVDWHRLPSLTCEQTNLVHGDARSMSIAAASILAKVERDEIMRELDRHHPGYGFAQHKGYPTREHYAALARLGPCPEHRRGFRLAKPGACAAGPDCMLPGFSG